MYKFKKIEVHLLNLKLKHPFTTSFGTQLELKHPLIKLTTQDGLIGLAEIPTLIDPAYKPESDTYSVLISLEKFVIPSLVKTQKQTGGFDTIGEFKKSYQWIKGANFAKSGLETAFWDIIAQQQQQPLWQLWGGNNLQFLVGVSVGGKTIDEVVSRVDQAIDQGYKRIKIKIWPGFDYEPVQKVREKYPELLIQVDANSAYNLDNWKQLKQLDNLNLLLIEQPLFDDDIIFHSEISKELNTPICLDESIHSLENAKSAALLWEKNSSLNKLVINIKPPRVSGFDESIKIAEFCKSKGIKTWIGGMLDSALGKTFNLNFNSLDSISLPGDHFSPTGDYFEADILQNPPQSQKGLYTLSEQVSSGAIIDQKNLAKLSTKLFEVTLL